MLLTRPNRYNRIAKAFVALCCCVAMKHTFAEEAFVPPLLEIRSKQTIIEDFNLLKEISGQVDDNLSCSLLSERLNDSYSDRIADIKRIQSLLNHEEYNLGNSGCDGIFGSLTLTALGSKVCGLPTKYTDKHYSSCDWIGIGATRIDSKPPVKKPPHNNLQQFVWTKDDSALLDTVEGVQDELLIARDYVVPGQNNAIKTLLLTDENADELVPSVRLFSLLTKNQVTLEQLRSWFINPNSTDVKQILESKLQGDAFPTRKVFEDAVCDFLNNRQLDTSVEWTSVGTGCDIDNKPVFLSMLSEVAAKPSPVIDQGIDYVNNDCGCAHPQENSAIYGVYPFWMDKSSEAMLEEPATPVSVAFDFSLYNTIEYLAGTLELLATKEMNFVLSDNRSGRNNSRSSFIKESTRHLSRVDMMIRIDADAFGAFKSLNNQQLNKLALKIANTYNNDGFSGVTFWLPASIGDNGPVNPKEDKDIKALEGFINLLRGMIQPDERKLDLILASIPSLFPSFKNKHETADDQKKSLDQDNLQQENARQSVNILITGSFDKSIKSISRIQTLITRVYGGNPTAIDNVLMFLTQPTTKNKKKLREHIENTFKGSSRRNALRKIIPITLATPSIPGRATGDFDENLVKNQMFSDLNYYEDNYGGAGTWGLSLVEENTESMSSLVKSVFDKGHTGSNLQFCDYICPRRGWITPSLSALSILLAGFVFLQKLHCVTRQRLKRFDKPVFLSGLMLAGLWYVFISCVPTWGGYQLVLLILLLLGLSAIIGMSVLKRGRVDP